MARSQRSRRANSGPARSWGSRLLLKAVDGHLGVAAPKVPCRPVTAAPRDEPRHAFLLRICGREILTVCRPEGSSGAGAGHCAFVEVVDELAISTKGTLRADS